MTFINKGVKVNRSFCGNHTSVATELSPDVVFVVLVVGPISTAAMKAYCTLHPNGVPSFISRGTANQAA
jgi:hypothetical protein